MEHSFQLKETGSLWSTGFDTHGLEVSKSPPKIHENESVKMLVRMVTVSQPDVMVVDKGHEDSGNKLHTEMLQPRFKPGIFLLTTTRALYQTLYFSFIFKQYILAGLYFEPLISL